MSADVTQSTLPVKELLKPTGFIAPAEMANKTFSELAGSMEYKLYAWDYGSGAVTGYTEHETPETGDLIFLKEDMAEGEITDPSQLKLIYHIVSVTESGITVSEHPEGQTGGYTFTRDEEKDYEETVSNVSDTVTAAAPGLYGAAKGRAYKMVEAKGTAILAAWQAGGNVIYTRTVTPKVGDAIFGIVSAEGVSTFRNTTSNTNKIVALADGVIRVGSDAQTWAPYARTTDKDVTF